MFKRAGVSVLGVASMAALGVAAAAVNPAQASSTIVPATAPPTANDINILNFALNLEYLDSTFYHIALLGTPLAAADTVSGNGATPGATPLMTGAGPVPFQTDIIRQLGQDLAADEQAQVRFIRNTLGASAVGLPLIDLSVGPTSAFNMVALQSGYIQPGQIFNPYRDENSFLLGGYIFEDVAVTAYGGSAALLSQASALVQYASSLQSVEAYHAATIRTLLAIRGGGAATDGISNLRSMLSSGAAPGTPNGDDFGTLDPVSGDVVLAPVDANGLSYRRSVAQVLNIVYGNVNRTPGLFFPNGLNVLPGVTGFS